MRDQPTHRRTQHFFIIIEGGLGGRGGGEGERTGANSVTQGGVGGSCGVREGQEGGVGSVPSMRAKAPKLRAEPSQTVSRPAAVSTPAVQGGAHRRKEYFAERKW